MQGKESTEIKKSNPGTGRGGRRPGAGRKAGSATKKTREIADRAAREGLTPLEVMLKTMRALVRKAEAVSRGKVKEGEKVVSPLDLMVEAAAVAKDAAPYMHPRLASVEMAGPNQGPIPVTTAAVTPEQLAETVRSVREQF